MCNNIILFTAQTKFKLNSEMRVSVLLKDNYGTKIHTEEFCAIVRNFSKSGSFYINLEFDVIDNNATHVSKEVLRYLNTIKCLFISIVSFSARFYESSWLRMMVHLFYVSKTNRAHWWIKVVRDSSTNAHVSWLRCLAHILQKSKDWWLLGLYSKCSRFCQRLVANYRYHTWITFNIWIFFPGIASEF